MRNERDINQNRTNNSEFNSGNKINRRSFLGRSVNTVANGLFFGGIGLFIAADTGVISKEKLIKFLGKEPQAPQAKTTSSSEK